MLYFCRLKIKVLKEAGQRELTATANKTKNNRTHILQHAPYNNTCAVIIHYNQLSGSSPCQCDNRTSCCNPFHAAERAYGKERHPHLLS